MTNIWHELNYLDDRVSRLERIVLALVETFDSPLGLDHIDSLSRDIQDMRAEVE